jgi:large subunit ribosomal protein L4|tara:strand:- start:142 stop:768 length:627 start_codon:yes stop_codon:yes gene_type:complete
MKINTITLEGKKSGNIDISDSVFNIKPNNAVVRQVVLAELTNMRQGTHSSKNRSKVNGGGKKPWKQKGRGAARAGTNRSPLWRGGGTVFGPSPHSYNHKVSKKLSRLARKSLLSFKIADEAVTILDSFKIDSHKTSDLVRILTKLNIVRKKITVITKTNNNNFDLASRNLQNVYIVSSQAVSAYDLIDCEHLVLDKESINDLNRVLSN